MIPFLIEYVLVVMTDRPMLTIDELKAVAERRSRQVVLLMVAVLICFAIGGFAALFLEEWFRPELREVFGETLGEMAWRSDCAGRCFCAYSLEDGGWIERPNVILKGDARAAAAT